MAQSKKTKTKVSKTVARRDEILDVAANLFYRKGFDATTTQDIAERVGMLKGSLYYYFDSKEQMLYEIIDQVHEVFTHNLATIEALDVDPVEETWAFIYTNVKANVDHYLRSAIFFNIFRSQSTTRRRRVVQMRDRHDHMLRQLITAGQADGLMRADIDPKITAIALLTMCNAVERWYKPRGQWAADHIARSYADLTIASLIATPAQLDRIDRDRLIQDLATAAATVTNGNLAATGS